MSAKNRMRRRNVRRRPRSWRPRLEWMEDRRMLAGNVLATQLGTTLTLLGDELGNEIMVRSGQLPDEIIVHGMNQTQVNGTSQDWTFEGVERIDARFQGGDDWFKATDLILDATLLSFLLVDGGTGDDKIELKNTEVHADSQDTRVQIYGEISSAATTPTTGNDTIQLANTKIITGAGVYAVASVSIYGEQNLGGQVTGGNDTITVTDTEISATGGVFQDNALLEIFGDFNQSFGANVISTIGEGNDSISVTNTTVTAADGTFFNSAFLNVFGDFNDAFSLSGPNRASTGGGNDSIAVTNTTVTATDTSGDNFGFLVIFGDVNRAVTNDSTGQATVDVGGNDSIAVTNTTISATGGTLTDAAQVIIVGDHNTVVSNNAITTVTAGGNDTISVDNADITATGGIYNNSAHLAVYGEINAVSFFGGVALIEAQGNDAIEVKNSRIVSTGTGFDFSSILIVGEFGLGSGGSVVTDGDDDVVLQHVEVSGEAADVNIDTATGNDELDVKNSFFDRFFASLGEGDDVALFTANDFLSADLDGGLGHDVLTAHNNRGALTHSNFEEENVTT